MDIIGKESLENILKEYKGTLIFVSHDRYFVNKIADSMLIFETDNVMFFNGKYDEYKEKEETLKESMQIEKTVEENTRNKGKSNTNNQYFINKEQRKIKNKIGKLENEINNLEDEIRNIENEMIKEENSSDYIKLEELQKKIDELNKIMEEKMIEWNSLIS